MKKINWSKFLIALISELLGALTESMSNATTLLLNL
jgi:hypothetical protein